jgi:subtilase family serine protease
MAARSGRLALTFLAAFLAAQTLQAAPPVQKHPQITRYVDDADRVVLSGNVHPWIAERAPIGQANRSLPMEKMILSLKMAPEAKVRLDTLLAEQQDPKSPNYHRWLTPAQFGAQFGPAESDLDAVKVWLLSQGFSIDEVAPSGLTITFSSPNVETVELAFRTSVMEFEIDGHRRQGNFTNPSIPAALAGAVNGVVSLHNIPRPAHNLGARKLSAADATAVAAKHAPDWKGTANGTSGVYLSPSDWAVIYNANTTYTSNGNGTGAVIGIVGRTNPGTANWAKFRSTLGLPVNTPTIIVNGTNPGDLGAGEDGEADLDAEWSGGVAPGATVKFVTSKSTNTTDGVDLSAQYIVNNNLADVMSTSFGQCESSMGSTENAFYNNLWSQAASQGITSCVSTGDSGAAGCTGGSSTSGSGYSGVNGLASTPYNIAVGATQLSTSSAYWTSGGVPTGYIPETPWNESGSVSGGSGLWSTSSGASSTYAKPSWQVCTGVPTTSHRYLPDVSLDGSDMFFGNYGMLVYSQGAMATTGGTSASSPSFAGVMALIVQKYGRQGNANTTLYQLGNAQYSGTGTAVFHDITSGNNNVPGLTGFTAGTGWDEVTGLGTPDVTALVNNWSGSVVTAPTITTQPANQTVAVGQTATFTVVASGSGLSYQWYKGTSAISGATAASYTTPATTTSDNSTTFHVVVTNSAGSVTSNNATLTVTATVTAPTITGQPANATVTAPATATFTVTASGTAPLSYQWRKNGTNISGATSASYTTPATSATDNGSTFSVVVSNSAGSATSSNATLTVTSSGTTYTEVESNNTRTTANVVADAVTKIVGYMSSTSDIDYYKVNVQPGKSITINMTGPSGVDYDLYFLNSSGSTLKSSTGTTATESITYANTSKTATVFYIKVISYSGSSTTTPYNLALTR